MNDAGGSKLYYSISEVSKLAGVEQHVLRYWESEFPKLKPKKNRAGNRQYREKDIKIVRYIRHLLHDEMYTIQGAKKLSESGYKEVEGQLDLLSAIAQVAPLPPPPPAAPTPPEVAPPVFEPAPAPDDIAIPSGNGELLRQVRDELKAIRQLLC